MKRIKRFFGIFGFLLALIFVLWLFESPASAEVLETVKLTKEQALALFGRSISAQYYDGSQWQNCTFSYYGSSDQYVNDGHTGITMDYTTYVTQIENMGMTSQEQDTLFRYNTFLFYKLDPVDLATTPSTSGQLQFSIDFTIDIKGIKSFRQLLLMSKDREGQPTAIENCPLYYYSNVTLYPSIESSPVIRRLTPADNLNAANAVVTNYIRTPFTYRSTHDLNFDPFAYFCVANAGYSKMDSNSIYQSFDMSGLQFNINRCRPLKFNDSTQSNQLGYVIGISTPIVTDGYILPDSGGSGSGDYTDILNSNNTLLAQILAKLELIYRDMYRENNASLNPPQTIGFDSSTKSEIIGGLSSGASVLDSQSVPEAAQQAAGGVWAASDRILGSAPGLAAIYLFIFVSGLVSWVIFGKRGG